MSENIRGITFAEQAVTPADDAIVRRAVLGDGILTGCEITYSGSTLTMASGFIIACGRAFQITASQNWAVVDATSGVARLLLTIDLTQTATEDTFNQISFSIEYAASEDGFVDLVQEDINISGTKYQIVAAVVSLGTGGITGIVSKLEKTEGGGGLNFKVVDGLTQPGSATENTIWVKTQGMTGWIIDANQPENLTEGMVWISVGKSSTVEFNALKKNGLQVYPLYAKQYISGALVNVTAMSYQGGEWHYWGINLISAGSVTNEYGKFGNSARYTYYSANHCRRTFSITANSGYAILRWVYYSGSTGYDSSYAYFEEKIDLTDISTIIIDTGNAQFDSIQNYRLSVCSNVGDNASTNAVANVSIGANTETILDVSALSGSYYILITQYSYTAEATYIEIKDWRMFP